MKKTDLTKFVLLGLTFFAITIVCGPVGAEYTEISAGSWGGGISDSAPAVTDLDGDGLIDILVGESQGQILHYEQDVAGSTSFTRLSSAFSSIDVGTYATPCVVDLDGDGLLDLLVGEKDGNINHYEQAGSGTFDLVTATFNAIDVGRYAAPTTTDIDGDGLIDLLIGEEGANLNHYEQAALGSTTFNLLTETLLTLSDDKAKPTATDLNADGLIDLIVGFGSGASNGHFDYYKQDAAGSSAFSTSGSLADVGNMAAPTIVDIDGDGLEDYFWAGGFCSTPPTGFNQSDFDADDITADPTASAGSCE